MKWKVGDKVRLVGKEWPEHKSTWARGTVHEITKVRGEDDVQFKGDGYPWFVGIGWEIELVERKEENMIDISDVNVGERVKLSRENGDEATFTVTERNVNTLVSKSNSHYRDSWDTMEIVERAFKPVPGLYTNYMTLERVMIAEGGETYYTTQSGAWVPIRTGIGRADDAARENGDWSCDIAF